MNNDKSLRTIRRTSAIGLWGAVAIVVLTAAFLLSPYTFRASEYTARWMLIAGSVLAVLAVSMVLLTVRKHVPELRQSEGLEKKLAGYASHVQSLYLSMLAVVAVVCAFVVLSGQNMLLMLAIITVLMLFLNYPNMYRLKVDLGLGDDEMRLLFGDRYIAGDE